VKYRVQLLVAEMLPCPAQPPHRPAQVDDLVRWWNPEHLAPLRVYRRDGMWWIRNGQHRWLAAIRLGILDLPCDVVDGPARAWWNTTLHVWAMDDGVPVDPRLACTCARCVKRRARPELPWSQGRAVVRPERPLDSDDNRS